MKDLSGMKLGSPARLDELAFLVRGIGSPHSLNVLEWGSGESTDVLLKEVDSRESGRLVTIDHNLSYQEEVLADLMGKPRLIALALDLTGDLDADSPELTYATKPLSMARYWDLIVIDGRRRLECALVASIVSLPGTVIALHDYRRARYAPVLEILSLIADQPEYRVMKPKVR
jgi:hypothetical protein